MCGRFSLFTPPREIREKFKLTDYPDVAPSYNVAPSQTVAAILNTKPDKAVAVQWGIVPHWAKDEKSPKGIINARAETLAEKRTFAPLLEKTRCVIPADGFYEWKTTEEGKQPYRFEYKKGLFGFAGLWNEWQKEEGGPMHRFCAIITCAPNKVVHEIHDRMPVILDPNQTMDWLEKGDTSLLTPLADKLTDSWPVSKAVNSPGNNRPEIMNRYEPPSNQSIL
ncbi:SOS response-associated peptidase [Candidatus Micrarchaeota archaeon]|nr:SOS response-associated peptidase [Candidatus Micrarchaeota archaeon]